MKHIRATVYAFAVMFAGPSFAGLYTDDLSRCVVDSTSAEDRANLMKWIFVAMAQHPSVAAFATVKPTDVDAANKTTAELFTRLLTESCAQKARDAIRIEGLGAIQAAFQLLGQVASTGLMSDAKVAQAMSGLDKYLDKSKFDELSKPTPAASAK